MVWWWWRDRERGDRPDRWRDIAESWDDRPAARRSGRRSSSREEDWDDEDWDDDEWDDEDDWDEEEDWDDRDRRQGWQDPDPGPKRESFLSWLLLLPVRLILFPFRFLVWFVGLCLIWVAVYGIVDPPFWYHLDSERERLGSAVAISRDLDDVSPNLVRAVMAAEDADFCDHWGLDFGAIRAAIRERREGGRLLGASTITQQAAKNMFLWHDRTWLRKGLEAVFALAMEALWSKRRIIEVYLNVAEFDTGTFGAEAAARKYFDKRAADLTLGEAARLAAVLPDPQDRNAADPGPRLRGRAQSIADGARTLERTGRDACVFGGEG